MDWKEFENIIVVELKTRYQSIPDDLEKADFLIDIREAKEELLKLNSDENVNYSIPYVGEAYTIYYHMQRADNIYLALSEVNKLYAIPPNLRVLDVGSGTGSGTTAICYWIALREPPNQVKTIEVYAVERSESMTKIAASLLDRLRTPMNARNISILHL